MAVALGDHTGRYDEQEGVICFTLVMCPSCLLLQESCRVSLGPTKSLHDSVTQNEGPPFLGAGRMVLCSCERSPFRAGMLPQCMKVTALSSSLPSTGHVMLCEKQASSGKAASGEGLTDCFSSSTLSETPESLCLGCRQLEATWVGEAVLFGFS